MDRQIAPRTILMPRTSETHYSQCWKAAHFQGQTQIYLRLRAFEQLINITEGEKSNIPLKSLKLEASEPWLLPNSRRWTTPTALRDETAGGLGDLLDKSLPMGE